MPGQLLNWPDWVEHKSAPDLIAYEEEFTKAKAAIIAEYGKDALFQGWVKACKELKAVTDYLAARGSTAVPVFEFDQIRENNGLSEAQREQIKSSGCCIIRNTISEAEAKGLFDDLRTFVAANTGQIKGWPPESSSILNLYNSPTQVKIRTHANQIFVQRELNALFNDASGETSPNPLSYTDALRIRPPGSPILGLGPHIDAGSLCRWADPQYRKVYARIFAGNPEEHDAYDLQVRKDADQALYKASAHSSVFRSFQGWTALTPASPNCGTLMLYPTVKAVIAYVMLRPFVEPPSHSKDIMDGSKWTFNEDSAWFPGTTVPDSQRLSVFSHPHLRLKECLVHIPPMQPGDTVWWHTDMCHAVDPEHQGEGDAAVAYVAACPTTKINSAYVKKQLQAALAGRAPPDFIGVEKGELHLKGYEGVEHVSEAGKAVLGFGLV